MSEAKTITSMKGDRLWAGPRAVFHRSAFTADATEIKSAVKAAAAAKLDGVEWVLPQGQPADSLRTLANLFTGMPAQHCAAATAVTSTDLEAVVHEINEAMEPCHGLGATCLNVALPPVGTGVACPDAPEGSATFARYQDHLNFAFQLLHRLRFTAERSGVALAIEAATGGGLLSPVELREMIDEANSVSVGTCLDIERLGRIGSPADWIDTLRHRVHAVRFGTGPADETVLTALARIGYDRTCVVTETTAASAIREAMG